MAQPMMEQKRTLNMGQNERILSLIGGTMLLGAGIRRMSLAKLPLALGGVYLLFRGATGKDPVYNALGIERAGQGGREGICASASITINKPRAEVYRFFRDFERLPSFMRHLESVSKIYGEGTGSRWRWVAKAPLGMQVEWDSEVTEDRPNEMMAWRTLSGADVDHHGRVTFRDAPIGRGTEVRAELMYRVPGGSAGAMLAALFGEEPEMQIQEDFKRMKQLLETGQVASTEGQPSGRAS